ncbi:serine protease gd-like [Episyrphus balteatus]|uniref:serine protease gd-like n=1 Tax=Episyrphus balteatus TaxID=286459 RepID=UPI0024851BD9|nr:serine protease gd-like [Episyrphus balteatus]
MILCLLLVTFVTAVSAKSLPSEINPPTFEYLNSICGQENSNNDINQFPWAVSILKKDNAGNLQFSCGGSLISTRTVVTSAHCFNDYSEPGVIRPENFLASLGGHNTSTSWIDAVNKNIEKIIIRPGYNPETLGFDSDLALVQLKQPIIFTESIKPICIGQEVIDDDATGKIPGWNGRRRQMETTTPTLINARVVSATTCLRSHNFFSEIMSNQTICVELLDRNTECMINSGNGLMIKKENKWMLKGVVAGTVSDPKSECGGNKYFVSLEISKFYDWIRSNMLL